MPATSVPSNAVLSMQPLSQRCPTKSTEEKMELEREMRHYELSSKFQSKMDEVTGKKPIAGLHSNILSYLENNVLQSGFSVLDLGCAAGLMLKEVKALMKSRMGSHGHLVGVELVPGWVEFASSNIGNATFYQGDITDFTLPNSLDYDKFDVVMLNDVLEHVQTSRYSCLLDRINLLTKEHSILYMHTPSEQAQIAEKGQFYENGVPFQTIVSGLAARNFELAHFQYDFETKCGGRLSERAPKLLRRSNCNLNGWPKYYHAMFRRTGQ